VANPKERQQRWNTLTTYADPIIGGVEVSEVKTGPVLEVLNPIWRMKPETANRV
jgi:hypothetical protein